MSVKLEIGDYERRTEEIRKEVSSIYLQYEKQEAADSLTSALKDIKSEDKICLSFVGQYSAGKSTIIKALGVDTFSWYICLQIFLPVI